MTETARLSDYVLPATTQFEKFEATFFNFKYPRNVFHLRRPVCRPSGRAIARAGDPPRIVEATGLLDPEVMGSAASRRRAQSRRVRRGIRSGHHRRPRGWVPISERSVLYRTLGPTLPHGAAAAASLWPMVLRSAPTQPRRGQVLAGFGAGPEAGDRLFDAIVDSPSGVVFTDDTWEATWQRIKTDGRPRAGGNSRASGGTREPHHRHAARRRSAMADAAVRGRASFVHREHHHPRSCLAQEGRWGTLHILVSRCLPYRAHRWRVRQAHHQAGQCGRGRWRSTTRCRPGHISLPNGFGLDHLEGSGERVSTGVGTNVFTAMHQRPRPMGRHPVARVRPGPAPAGVTQGRLDMIHVPDWAPTTTCSTRTTSTIRTRSGTSCARPARSRTPTATAARG